MATKAAARKGSAKKAKSADDVWREEIVSLHRRLQDSICHWKGYYDQGQAFHVGNHYGADYDPYTRQLTTLPTTRVTGPQLVCNIIGPTNDLIGSVITAKMPTFCVRASQYEGRRESLAGRTMTSYMKRLAVELDWDRAIADFYNSAIRLGGAAIQVFWNMGKGAVIDDPETGERLKIGAPDLRYIHPGQIMVPAGWTDEDIALAPYVLVEHVMLVADIHRDYPNCTVEPETDLIESNGSWRVSELGEPYGDDQEAEIHQCAVVLEYWERPSEKYPEGRFIVTTRSEVLSSQDSLPLQFAREKGLLPFAWLNYLPEDRQLRGRAATHSLRDWNYYINLIQSRRVAAAFKLSQPKMMLQKGAGVDKDTFRNPDKTIVEYSLNSRFSPSWLQPPQEAALAAQMFAEFSALVEQTTGVSEVLAGQNPDAVRGVAHIAMLNELANKRFEGFNQRRKRALRRVGQMLLWLIAEKIPDELGEQQVGNCATLGWQIFKANAFKLDFNLDIDEDSAIFQLPIIKRQEIYEQLDRGLFGDPADPKTQAKVREALGLSNPEEISREEDLQRNRAEWENWRVDQIAAGLLMEPPPVPEYVDDATIHVSMHKEFVLEALNVRDNPKTPDFERQIADMSAQMMMQHIGMHEQQDFLQQQPMSPEEIGMQNQGMMPVGAPQQPPTPAPPEMAQAMPIEQMPFAGQQPVEQLPTPTGEAEFGGGLPPQMLM